MLPPFFLMLTLGMKKIQPSATPKIPTPHRQAIFACSLTHPAVIRVVMELIEMTLHKYFVLDKKHLYD